MEAGSLRPLLLASFLIATAVGLAVPLALAFTIRRRWGVPWRILGCGALVFLIFQLLTRQPLLQGMQFLLQEQLQRSAGIRLALLAFAALTAGLFEEIGRYAGYRWWVPEARSWREGVAFGLGHGGLEMFLLGGLSSLATTVAYLTYAFFGSEARVPAGQEAALATARHVFATMPVWFPLVGAFERLTTLAIHVALSLMVLRVFTGGGPAWLVAATAFHTLVDLAAVLPLLPAVPRGLLWAELLVAAFAAFSLWFIRRQRDAGAG